MLVRSIAFFLIFMGQFSLFAREGTRSDVSKFNVDLADLTFQGDGMYYFYNGQRIPLLMLECVNGIYTASAPTSIFEDILGVWWCYSCQHWNSKYDGACVYCGNPK